MGRTIIADEKIQTYAEKLQKEGTWFLGLIIGKLTNQKDYAIHMVRTPEPVEDAASDDDDTEVLEQSEASSRKRRKSQTKPPSLEEMNEQWASTHAKQVTMMLPGGLNVIGIFALAPETMMLKSQAKLRQILFAIQKQDKKSQVPEMSNSFTDRILLQICSTTRKYTCKTIDVQDPKSTFRPADWKFQTLSERWNCLETNISLTVPVHIPEKSNTSSLTKQIQTGLQPFCKQLWTSLVQIDGSLRDKTELLDQSSDKKVKGKDKTQKTQQIFMCNILTPPSEPCSLSAPVIETCSTSLTMRGTIHGRAYVTSKSTVEEAQQTLQRDVIRSVLSRSELLCDDLQMIEEDTEKLEVYTTPRRVFFKLPGTSIQLSDYMFTDEKPIEVKGRVQELLDICIDEEDLDLTTERPPTEEDCARLQDEEHTENGVPENSSESNKGLTYYLIAGVGGAFAMVLAGISYMMAEES
ncbi:hypothetical protein ACF0H5_021919 [Mactra antiquata]